MKERLKAKALALGFSMVGVVSARPGRTLSAYLNWLDQTYHGEMGYLSRPDRLSRRRDLNVIVPNVQSIVCVGLDYHTLKPPAGIVNDPGRGRISNYAWGVDYHDVMTPRLKELASWLAVEAKEAVSSKVYVDTGAILERDHAEQAGLGFTGKNTMLINHRRGSWFFLGELLTTLRLEPDVPGRVPSCGSCVRCLTACPTKAFPKPYVLDARRCISYLTIELKGWIPRALRSQMGNWIYGCDVCQVVCPFNRFAVESGEMGFRPGGWDVVAPPLLDLLALDQAGFDSRFAHSPIKRIKRHRLLRNACVAAGNWGEPSLVPLLVRLLDEPEPVVRGHSAWALGQIATPLAYDACQVHLGKETDAQVQEELMLVLETKRG